MTYGKGRFWNWGTPFQVVSNDIDPETAADLHLDCREIGLPDRSFDVCVFDPPFSRRSSNSIHERRGYSFTKSTDQTLSLLKAGISEALRLAQDGVVVKCQDQVDTDRRVFASLAAISIAPDLLREVVVLVNPSPLMHPSWAHNVHNFRSGHSYLLVFQHKSRDPS